MNVQKYLIVSLLLGFSLLAVPLAAAEGSMYGHISFVDKGATILRADGSKDEAVVNLPLAPGDTVITLVGGRCELQFDNGTVVRLDKASRLRLASVLAPSLTSNLDITTLELEEGQMYTLPQSYDREIFQIITPNAAVNLKSRVRATIRLDADGGTSFFSDGGKFQLLYGADSRSLKKATVKTDRPLAITAAHVPAEQVRKRDIEFSAWNEYVDRHFKELHYGINKIPPKLKFENAALTHWAEKWSSLFGEWIYDDLFGYVWRPADEQFAHTQRPFFHASFMRMNGELFLVPQEAWGWVPAHMGTWVWMKRGWTWIPGGWFHNGIVDCGGLYSFAIGSHYYSFPTFDYFWQRYFYWQPGWPNRASHGSDVPGLPDPLIRLIRKVGKAPDSNESKRLAIGKAKSTFDGVKLPPAPVAPAPATVSGAAASSDSHPVQDGGGKIAKADEIRLVRDWNPDNRWAKRRFVSIRYSGNAVVCPELEISSDKMSEGERMKLRESAGRKDTRISSGDDASQPTSSGSTGTGVVTPPPAAAGSNANDRENSTRNDAKDDKK